MVIVYVAAIILGILLCLTGFALFFMSSQPTDPSGTFFSLVWLRFVTLPLGLGLAAWGGNGLRRSRHAKASQKTKSADEELRVYESTDSHSSVVAKLPEGSDIELGPVTEANGVDWLNVTLPDGRQGYILGNAHVHTMLKGVVGKDSPMYDFPDLASPPVGTIPAGTELEIVKGDWDSAFDQIVMVRAWLPDGRKTHIKSNTRVTWT